MNNYFKAKIFFRYFYFNFYLFSLHIKYYNYNLDLNYILPYFFTVFDGRHRAEHSRVFGIDSDNSAFETAIEDAV